MRQVATFLGLGLALVSALALIFWIQVGQLEKEALKRERDISLVEQENAKLKKELEKEQKKTADLEEDASDVHRLRGEVARLTRTAAEIDRVKAELSRLEQENRSLRRNGVTEGARPPLASGTEGGEDAQVPGLFLRDDLEFRGTETPEDTAVSYFSSLLGGNFANLLKCMSPRGLEQMPEELKELSDQEIEQFAAEMSSTFTGIHVLGTTQLSEDTIQVNVHLKEIEEAFIVDRAIIPIEPTVVPMRMRQIDGQWLLDYVGMPGF